MPNAAALEGRRRNVPVYALLLFLFCPGVRVRELRSLDRPLLVKTEHENAIASELGGHPTPPASTWQAVLPAGGVRRLVPPAAQPSVTDVSKVPKIVQCHYLYFFLAPGAHPALLVQVMALYTLSPRRHPLHRVCLGVRGRARKSCSAMAKVVKRVLTRSLSSCEQDR